MAQPIHRIEPKTKAWHVQGHLRLEDSRQVAMCQVATIVSGANPQEAIKAFQEAILDGVNMNPARRPRGMRKAQASDLMATMVTPMPDVAQKAAELVAEALARASFDSKNPSSNQEDS